MSLDLSPAVRTDLEDTFTTLKTPYKWRAVTSYFKDEVPSRDFTSNLHVVPFVGDRVVLLHAKESGGARSVAPCWKTKPSGAWRRTANTTWPRYVPGER